MIKSYTRLTCKEITLEYFTSQDIDRLIAWINNEKELIQFAGPIFQFPLTREQLENYLKDRNRTAFKIIHNESGNVIGHCEAYAINTNTVRLCRILLGDKTYRGKGLGLTATSELVKWCLKSLKAKNIDLNVYDFNTVAINCYKKLGFEETQEIQETKYKGETWKSIRMRLNI